MFGSNAFFIFKNRHKHIPGIVSSYSRWKFAYESCCIQMTNIFFVSNLLSVFTVVYECHWLSTAVWVKHCQAATQFLYWAIIHVHFNWRAEIFSKLSFGIFAFWQNLYIFTPFIVVIQVTTVNHLFYGFIPVIIVAAKKCQNLAKSLGVVIIRKHFWTVFRNLTDRLYLM